MHRAKLCFFIAFCLSGSVGQVRAASSDGDLLAIEKLQDTIAEVADLVRPSVVAIRAERKLDEEEFDRDVPDDETHRPLRERRWPSAGTGVLISAEGHILTNEHVIHSARPEDIECLLANGETFTAQGITSDPRSDLAVIKIEGGEFRAARLGDASRVRQGHFVLSMGNPFGTASENSGRSALTFGVISALGSDLTAKLDLSDQHYYGNLIQTDAKINPGNSGGPLINLRGEVIGITTAISTRSGLSEGVGYAISVDERVKQIIEHLKRGEEVEYGFLGVKLERPTEAQRKNAGAPVTGGAVVREVTSGAPADGKLAEGDIVVEFNRRHVDDVDQLIRLVGAAPVGQEIEIKVIRSAQMLSLNVVPARRKQALKGIHVEAPLNWRGMRLADLSPELRATYKLGEGMTGVIVTKVDIDGAASRSGIKAGFVIQQVDDTAIRGLRDLRPLLAKSNGPTKLKAADSENEIILQ